MKFHPCVQERKGEAFQDPTKLSAKDIEPFNVGEHTGIGKRLIESPYPLFRIHGSSETLKTHKQGAESLSSNLLARRAGS